MTLLRASSQAIGGTADLEATVGQGGDGGIPHGDVLVRFGESISRGSDDAAAARAAAREALGPAGFVEASGIVGIFNGLVRTADSTGIPLDDGTRNASVELRKELGIDSYSGAANTDLDAATPDPEMRDVAKLFR